VILGSSADQRKPLLSHDLSFLGRALGVAVTTCEDYRPAVDRVSEGDIAIRSSWAIPRRLIGGATVC